MRSESEKRFIHDRVGTAFTIAAMGGGIGGMLIGGAATEYGILTVPNPVYYIAVGFGIMFGAVLLAGWYFPTDAEIARKVMSRHTEDES